ncbi:hypothetical protein RA307_30555 [Xanthobacteraceae bacterium Astr-EGSB]|uniref:hypothetical protein n=1 Tax=Astrobacterium formosum TaxID=3069710 RepID=UPI0027B38B83|nr:hypothetical protein [Xanthobacteraceae bacterium Astr-EGSB]
MSEAPALADLVADVDVLAVVDTILTRPRHGSMSASLAAIVAMAERIRDLDAIATGTAELLAGLEARRGFTNISYAVDAVRHDAAIAPVIDGLAGALAALGYVQPTPPPSIQGDDT